MKYIKHTCHGKNYIEAILGKKGLSLDISPKGGDREPLNYLNTLWDDKCFEKINIPQVTGFIYQEERVEFAQANDIRVLDMPIKFANDNLYKIPKELQQFYCVIEKIAEHEHAINKNVKDYYCYITVDQKRLLKGQFTRNEGIHVDGFQGARVGNPLPIDHSYIIYDKYPTLFYNQKFRVGHDWDKALHNYYEGFQTQADEQNQIYIDPYSILLFNAYTLHQAPMAPKDDYRTFVRLTYSVREFDRLGNAHNPMFDYAWDMVSRSTPQFLTPPPDLLPEPPAIEKKKSRVIT